jgi:diguanylate cyclase (GGDEF)-like protein
MEYQLPVTKTMRWLTNADAPYDTRIRRELISGPFSSRGVLWVGWFNSLVMCTVAVTLQPSQFFIAWLIIDSMIWVSRLALLYWITKHGSQKHPCAIDLSLLLGLVWAAELGVGTAGCLISGDTILQVLGCTSMVSVNAAIAMRNQGVPRYAFTQILLTDVPMKLATLFQPEPLLRIFLLQAPLYLTGMWLLLNKLNDNVVRALLAEAKNEIRATHDPLTGLYNRVGILELIENTLTRTRHADKNFALLYIDLDGFKSINDNHGHAEGDKALAEFGATLKSIVRLNQDSAGRLGGDEFILLMNNSGVTSATLAAQRIIETLQQASDRCARPYALQASIGIALFEGANGASPTCAQTLIAHADGALYEAKRAGKNCFRIAQTQFAT